MYLEVNVNGCLEAQTDCKLYQEEPVTVFSLSWPVHQGRACQLSHLSQILRSRMSLLTLIVGVMLLGGLQSIGRIVVKIEGINIKNFRWTPNR